MRAGLNDGGWGVTGLDVVFVAAAGLPYDLDGLYAPLAAVGALALKRRRYQASVVDDGKTWDWSGYADHFTEDAKYVELSGDLLGQTTHTRPRSR